MEKKLLKPAQGSCCGEIRKPWSQASPSIRGRLDQATFSFPLKESIPTAIAMCKMPLTGAGTFYAQRPLPELPPGLVIGVADPLKALQETAAYYRRKFQLHVIGVTGSSGKTTTKDFIAGIISGSMPALKTVGNLNNEIGLPLTLLSLEEHHRAAVLEMGMSASGEIAALARLADPSIGVITNIGEAHMEHLGSVEAIAAAKGELLDYLGRSGTAVLNGDDPRLLEMGKRFPGKAYFQVDTGDIMRADRQGESSFFQSFPILEILA